MSQPARQVEARTEWLRCQVSVAMAAVVHGREAMDDLVPILGLDAYAFDDDGPVATACRNIWTTACRLYADGRHIDEQILFSEGVTWRDFAALFGSAESDHAAYSVGRAKDHARAAVQLARRQECAEIELSSVNMIRSGLLDEAQQYIVGRISDLQQRDMHGASLYGMAVDRLPYLLSGEPEEAIPTGLLGLDKMLRGGIRHRHLVLLCARPGAGKTAFALQWALNAMRRGYGVLYVSIDMNCDEIVDRVIAQATGIPLDKRGPALSEFEQGKIRKAVESFADGGFVIEDRRNVTVAQIAAMVHRARIRHSVDLVIVDYVQNLAAERTGESRRDELESISYQLKGLAKNMDVCVLAQAQLTRGGDQANPIHGQDYIKGSGQFEQDADVVITLRKPDEKLAQMYRDVHGVRVTDEEVIERNILLNIAKQRQGPVGTRWLFFDKPRQRFTEIARSTTEERVSSIRQVEEETPYDDSDDEPPF